MAKILYVGTHGTVDPTRATLPFILSVGALQAGHKPEIALLTDAVLLINDQVMNQIQGVGFAPLRELMAKVVEQEVPIYI